MTQKEQLLDMFRSSGGTLTLGQILNTTLAAEYRARMTDLRNQGYIIAFERGRTASENKYHLINKDENGQLRFVA